MGWCFDGHKCKSVQFRIAYFLSLALIIFKGCVRLPFNVAYINIFPFLKFSFLLQSIFTLQNWQILKRILRGKVKKPSLFQNLTICWKIYVFKRAYTHFFTLKLDLSHTLHTLTHSLFCTSFTHTHTHTLSLSLSYIHTYTHITTHTHKLSISHTHTHTISLSHTHTHTLSPSLSDTHTHTNSQSRFFMHWGKL